MRSSEINIVRPDLYGAPCIEYSSGLGNMHICMLSFSAVNVINISHCFVNNWKLLGHISRFIDHFLKVVK